MINGSEEKVRRLNTGRERLENLANIWAEWIGPWDERDRYRELGKATLEALSHGDQLDALRARIAELEADRDGLASQNMALRQEAERLRAEREEAVATALKPASDWCFGLDASGSAALTKQQPAACSRVEK
jgi:uncharacterized coiled-coil DUF342 family protein